VEAARVVKDAMRQMFVVSDAPSYDQAWLNRLGATAGQGKLATVTSFMELLGVTARPYLARLAPARRAAALQEITANCAEMMDGTSDRAHRAGPDAAALRDAYFSFLATLEGIDGAASAGGAQRRLSSAGGTVKLLARG
jgi:hypothetical protein